MIKEYIPYCENCGESLINRFIHIKENKRFCSTECMKEYEVTTKDKK